MLTDKELQEIKYRLANLEVRLGELGTTSPTTDDIRVLIKHVEKQNKRMRVLLHVARASVYMYAAGAGGLRGALQDLKREWPDWQSSVDMLPSERPPDD